MDAIADVTQRIADIQSKLTSLRPASVPFADVLQSSSAATGATTATAQVSGLDPASRAAAAVRPSWAAGPMPSSPGSLPAATSSAGGAAAAGPAATTPVARTRGVTVPDELRALGNGRIPASALDKIGHGGHRLAAKAAAAWKRMEAAAAQEGITLKVTDSYRDHATQVDLVRRKGLYSQGGLAAKPGTSNHGWGLAVDLDLNGKQQAWMRANGARFGFVEDTPREPWHWGFHG